MRKRLLIIILILGATTNSCGNLYTRFQSGDSDEYIMDRAIDLMDQGLYPFAIELLEPYYAAKPWTFRELMASAYAGQGGFTFFPAALTYQEDVRAWISGDEVNPENFLLETMIENASFYDASTTRKLVYVRAALEVLLGASSRPLDGSTRTEDINIFASFVGLAQSHLLSKILVDPANDETITKIAACNDAALTDDVVNTIGLGLYVFFDSIKRTDFGRSISTDIKVPDDLALVFATSPTPCPGAGPAPTKCDKLKTILLGRTALTSGLGFQKDTGAAACP